MGVRGTAVQEEEEAEGWGEAHQRRGMSGDAGGGMEEEGGFGGSLRGTAFGNESEAEAGVGEEEEGGGVG